MSFFGRLLQRWRTPPPQEFSPQAIADYYDEWTDRYVAVFGDTFQSLQTENRDDLFDYYIKSAELQDGQRILDAGCGICGPAVYFAQQLDVRIDALTISARQVELAQAHSAEGGVSERVHVQQGDFHQLADIYAPNTFDRVYFFEALVHAHDPAAVLQHAYAVLKPGGKLYVKDFYHLEPDGHTDAATVDMCNAATNKACFLTARKVATMEADLRAAGFVTELQQPLMIPAMHAIGHRFVEAYDLEVTPGLDHRTTRYLDYLEFRARKA